MKHLAILVGNSRYQHLAELPSCHNDILAITKILKATEKYSSIVVIEDRESSEVKEKLRNSLNSDEPIAEVLIYLTGHGCFEDDEFFYCPSDFDHRRPNATGLSTDFLHTLLRTSGAELVVKIIDACNSGTTLIKSDQVFSSDQSNEFRHLIQMSSCLWSENSFADQHLSLFTEKLYSAALRKTEGAIYYTDIIENIRDEFLSVERQTPFFIMQGTGREKFANSANCFSELRAQLVQGESLIAVQTSNDEESPAESNLKDLLHTAEEKIATAERVNDLVNTFSSV